MTSPTQNQTRSAGPLTRIERILETSEAIVEVAELAMRARGPLGTAAVALKVAHTGLRVWNTWRPRRFGESPESFFRVEDGWRSVPWTCGRAAMDGVPVNGQRQEEWARYNDDGSLATAAHVAPLDGGEVGWISPSATSLDETSSPFYVRGEGLMEAIRVRAQTRLWREAGASRMLAVGRDGLGTPLSPPTGVVSTCGIQETMARVRRFWDRGVFRTYVLDGEPGTGKTTAALHFARELGASAIVMEAYTLMVGRHPSALSDTTAWRPTMNEPYTLELMRPDVLVLNDVDRLMDNDQLQLLDLLGRVRGFARAVFITTNDHLGLIEPLRRPGRVDDVIGIPGLTIAEVAALVDGVVPDDLHATMTGWPIAYVLDVRQRALVLGADAVRAEIHHLAERLASVRAERPRDGDTTR